MGHGLRLKTSIASLLMCGCYEGVPLGVDGDEREAASFAQTIHVDCNRGEGDPTDGTQARPFNDLFDARNRVRALLPDVDGHIRVLVRGTCRLDRPLWLGPRDSGESASKQVIWEGVGNARLWGSRSLALQPENNGRWERNLPEDLRNTQYVWVGKEGTGAFRRASVAASDPFVLDSEWWGRARGVCNSDPDGNPVPPTDDGQCVTGFRFTPFRIHDDFRLSDVERDLRGGARLVYQRSFTMAKLPVRGVRDQLLLPRSGPLAAFRETLMWRKGAWPRTSWIENLRDERLIDRGGEFAVTARGQGSWRFTYQPRPRDERRIQVGRTSNLLIVNGSNWLSIRGFDFAFTPWHQGAAYVGQQAGAYIGLSPRPGASGRPWVGRQEKIPAAVEIRNASHIRITENVFRHTGGSALALVEGTNDVGVLRNVFYDIGGNGIEVDRRPVMFNAGPFEDATSDGDIIADNHLQEIGTEFLGGVAIMVGYSEDLSILRNRIQDTNYTGISVGYGFRNCHPEDESVDCWDMENTLVQSNFIENTMRRTTDGAAIYTLGQQPGTEISGNYIRQMVRPPPRGFCPGCVIAALYFDQGSAGIEAFGNQLDLLRRNGRKESAIRRGIKCNDVDDAGEQLRPERSVLVDCSGILRDNRGITVDAGIGDDAIDGIEAQLARIRP